MCPDVFQIEEWLPVFPLDAFDADIVHNPGGPAETCYVEQIRAQASKLGDLGRSMASDVFVLGYGEPDRRDVTKIGGLPYRPAGRPWPLSAQTGEPLTFAGQFRFTESRDIVDELPGDILLMFFQDTYARAFDEFAGPPVFEWYPLGLTDLIAETGLPLQPAEHFFPVCYGVRHRTIDYVEDVAIPLLQQVMPSDFIIWNEDTPTEQRHVDVRAKLACRASLKIGGSPFWRFPKLVLRDYVAPGRFLATLGQIIGSGDGLFPWINVRSLDEIDGRDRRMLTWQGEGVVHLFLDVQGNVRPRYEHFGTPDPPCADYEDVTQP